MQRLLLCSLAALLFFSASAQTDQDDNYDDSQAFKNSFFSGGSLGLQFGSVIMVDVSPHIGYYPLEHISVGTGFTYQYISDRTFVPRLDVNVYGGRVFSRFYLPVYESLFAHLEYEYMAYCTKIYSMNNDLEWITMNNLLAGAGYRQPIGGRSSLNLLMLWNFNESPYTLYTNPIVRIGVDIGL